MRKFSLTSPAFTGEMIFGYDAEGVLKFYENNAELKTEHLIWLSRNFPFDLSDLINITKKGTIREITDLSFEKFWELYDYKLSKIQAIKAWEKLNELDKLLAIEHIKRYTYYLKTNTNIAKLNAATYLNKRRFEDKYK